MDAVLARSLRSLLGLLWFALWFLLCFPWIALELAGEPVAEGAAWRTALALAIVAAALVVIVAATATFVRTADGTPVPLDPPRRFVATGLFRWVRNPMYLAYAAIVGAEAILFASATLALYGIGFAALAHFYVVRFEERELARRFGASYRRYCDSVPRWIPRRPRPRTACPENSGRVS